MSGGSSEDGKDEGHDKGDNQRVPVVPGRTKLHLRRRGTIWQMVGTLNGVPFRGSTKTDDKIRAEQIRSSIEYKTHCEATFGRDPVGPTLIQIVKDYVASVHPEPDTVTRLKRITDIAGPRFRADQVTQGWMEGSLYPKRFPQGTSEASKLRDCYTPLHAVLTRAFRIDALSKMPKLLKPSAGGRRTDYLTVGEAEAMLAHLDIVGGAFVQLLLCTGPRRGNACRLRWEDLNLQHGWVTYRKVKGQHGIISDLRVKLYPRAQSAMKELATAVGHTQGFVFTGPQKGGFASQSAFGALIGGILQRAADDGCMNRRVGCQLLRRTFATWHQAAFGNSKLLADVGGWASIDMADSYSQLGVPEMSAEVTEFWGLGTDLTQWKIPSVKIRR